MIFDKLENISRYDQRLSFIIEDLKNGSFSKGRFEINGDDSFGIGLEYETKTSEEGLWEAHRKYLDIHVVLEGEEYIEVTDIAECTPTMEYEEDYQLFSGKAIHSINLEPGHFLVLFPNEVHKTGVQASKKVSVRKNVYKLLL